MGDFMVIYGDFMVILWWLYGDFMVILRWFYGDFRVILGWFYGDFMLIFMVKPWPYPKSIPLHIEWFVVIYVFLKRGIVYLRSLMAGCDCYLFLLDWVIYG
jgi:hypothetical protein